jgi:hypothetical protein
MKPNILFHTIAHIFMVLFVYTAVCKLADMHTFRDEIGGSPFLGPIAPYVAIALPFMELLVAAMLFVSSWRLKGLYASMILMGLFTLYFIGNYFIDTHLSCSCGGIIEDLSPQQHLLFNSISILLAWVGIHAGKNNDSSSALFRWFNTSLTLLLFGAIGWMVLTAATVLPVAKTGLEGRIMPSFNLLLLDSATNFNTREIPNGKPFMVIGFSPYCPHCEWELHEITKSISRFSDKHIYLVSPFPIKMLKKIDNQFHLSQFANITIGYDSASVFFNYFKVHSIPFISLFDSKKRLGQAFLGRTDIATLTRCLK